MNLYSPERVEYNRTIQTVRRSSYGKAVIDMQGKTRVLASRLLIRLEGHPELGQALGIRAALRERAPAENKRTGVPDRTSERAAGTRGHGRKDGERIL